jgi:hypothetical protein
MDGININSKKLTEKEKYHDDKQWFKDCVNRVEVFGVQDGNVAWTTSWFDRFKQIKINLDLYNGIINESDFINIIAPFGESVGKLPANFNNKNIIYSKIKTVEGIELQRPFNYRLVAVNPEATTRKEKAKYERMQEWVVQNIMNELQEKIYAEHEQEFAQLEQMQQQGQQQQMQASQEPQVDEEGNPIQQQEGQPGMDNQMQVEQVQQMAQELEQRIQEEITQQTPEEINRYMARHYQDPAEVMFNQMLEYEAKRLQLNQKINQGCSFAAQTSIEVYRIYEKNSKPEVQTLNPMGFIFNKSLYSDRIEDSDFASYVYFMKPNEILNEYIKDLTQEDIKKLEAWTNDLSTAFTGIDNIASLSYTYSTHGVRVQHVEWKSLKKIQYLTYVDDEEQVQQTIVNGDYKLDPEIGDLELEEDWVLTKYEGTKIGSDIFVRMREVPGQHGDITQIKECKLSYVGLVYERGISLIERLKNYQYLYDILMYRMELQTAKDKGHITAINQDIIPDNLTFAQWMMNAEKSGFAPFSTMKEGGKYYPFDVTNSVKEIDMSLTSDIDKYRAMAEFIDLKAGESIGVTKSMEGQIAEREAVSNVQQSITQGTTILQSFYITHDNVKKNVMEALINLAKDIYLRNPSGAIHYVLDDLSVAVLEMDEELLETTTLGFFAQESNLDYQQLQEIRQRSVEALSAGTIDMDTLILIYKAKSVQEAEEVLKAAKEERQKREDQVQQQEAQNKQELQQQLQDNAKELLKMQHFHKMEEIRLKGEIDLTAKQMELNRQIVYTAGFDDEKDRNSNNVADYVEYARKAQKDNDDLLMKLRKQQLDEDKFKYQQQYDKQKLEIERKKANKPTSKK